MQEHDKARRWRESHQLSVKELAERIGYSYEAVYWFERGETPPRLTAGKPHSPAKSGPIKEWVWLRFKRACEGLERELTTKKQFNW